MKNSLQLRAEKWITSPEKRELDIMLALGVLPVALPLGAAAIGLSRMIDGKDVIFRQDRVGGNRGHITISKIRTMRRAAEDTTGESINRITWFGSKLRPLGIDEIPQLKNVLDGSMSVIGPRLLMTKTIDDMEAAVPRDLYEKWVDTYDRSKPGIISSFHINNRTGQYDEQAMKTKAMMDIDDFYSASLGHDLQILRRAAAAGISMFFGKDKERQPQAGEYLTS